MANVNSMANTSRAEIIEYAVLLAAIILTYPSCLPPEIVIDLVEISRRYITWISHLYFPARAHAFLTTASCQAHEFDISIDVLARDAVPAAAVDQLPASSSVFPKRSTRVVRVGTAIIKEDQLHHLLSNNSDSDRSWVRRRDRKRCQNRRVADHTRAASAAGPTAGRFLLSVFDKFNQYLAAFTKRGATQPCAKTCSPASRQTDAKSSNAGFGTFRITKGNTRKDNIRPVVKFTSRKSGEILKYFGCWCGKHNIDAPCNRPKEKWMTVRALQRSNHFKGHYLRGEITRAQWQDARNVHINESHGREQEIIAWRLACVLIYDSLIPWQNELNPWLNEDLLPNGQDPRTVGLTSQPLVGNLMTDTMSYSEPAQVPPDANVEDEIELPTDFPRPTDASALVVQEGVISTRFEPISRDFYQGSSSLYGPYGLPSGLRYQTMGVQGSRSAPNVTGSTPVRDWTPQPSNYSFQDQSHDFPQPVDISEIPFDFRRPSAPVPQTVQSVEGLYDDEPTRSSYVEEYGFQEAIPGIGLDLADESQHVDNPGVAFTTPQRTSQLPSSVLSSMPQLTSGTSYLSADDPHQDLCDQYDPPAYSLMTHSSPSPMPREYFLFSTPDPALGTDFFADNIRPEHGDELTEITDASNERRLSVPERHAAVINVVDEKLPTDSSASESTKSTSTVIDRKGKGRDPNY